MNPSIMYHGSDPANRASILSHGLTTAPDEPMSDEWGEDHIYLALTPEAAQRCAGRLSSLPRCLSRIEPSAAGEFFTMVAITPDRLTLIQPKTSKTAAMTRAQRLQLAQQAEQEAGADSSVVSHQFPDGWTIRQPLRYGDLHREGELMGNCLSTNFGERMGFGMRAHEAWDDYNRDDYGDVYPDDDPRRIPHSDLYNDEIPENYNFFSLRDPDNLPHLTGELSDGTMSNVYGRNNSEPKWDHIQRLKQWTTTDPDMRFVHHYFNPQGDYFNHPLPLNDWYQHYEDWDNKTGPFSYMSTWQEILPSHPASETPPTYSKTHAHEKLTHPDNQQPSVMYHVAPQRHRDSIQQYGLDPSHFDSDDRTADPDNRYQFAPGAWLFSDLDDARWYKGQCEEPRFGQPHDLYQVAPSHPVIPDPFASTENGYYHPQPITPERLRLLDGGQQWTSRDARTVTSPIASTQSQAHGAASVGAQTAPCSSDQSIEPGGRTTQSASSGQMIPSLDELAPYRYDHECTEVASQLEHKWPNLKREDGYYMHPERGPGDHAWNIAPDGTIVDMTAAQHGYTEQQLEQRPIEPVGQPQHPEIIPPNHPFYPRYISYGRHWPGIVALQAKDYEMNVPEMIEYNGLDATPEAVTQHAQQLGLPIPQYDDDEDDDDWHEGKTAAAEHNLWWQPGQRGRGMVMHDGQVVTWPEEEMTHHERAYAMNKDFTHSFMIRPDGSYYNHEPIRHPATIESDEAIRQADPRLKPSAAPEYVQRFWESKTAAAPSVMYHISAVANRERIQRMGLVPGPPAVKYVWLFSQLATAQAQQLKVWGGSRDNDIWAVNTEGLNIVPDPHGWSNDAFAADVQGGVIEPSRLSLIAPAKTAAIQPHHPRSLYRERVETEAGEKTPDIRQPARKDRQGGDQVGGTDVDSEGHSAAGLRSDAASYRRHDDRGDRLVRGAESDDPRSRGRSAHGESRGRVDRVDKTHPSGWLGPDGALAEPMDKLYHTAPKQHRDSILANGLKAGGDPEVDPGPSVFMTAMHPANSTDPYFYKPERDDVYEVNVQGLPIHHDPWGTDIRPDEQYLADLGGSYYHPGDIPAERVRLLDEGVGAEQQPTEPMSPRGSSRVRQPLNQVPQPNEQSTPLTRVAQGQDTWTPGATGKGIYDLPTNTLHTWPFDMSHYEYARTNNLVGPKFYIEPDGYFYGLSNRLDEKLSPHIPSITKLNPQLHRTKGQDEFSVFTHRSPQHYPPHHDEESNDWCSDHEQHESTSKDREDNRKAFSVDGTDLDLMDTLAQSTAWSSSSGTPAMEHAAGTPRDPSLGWGAWTPGNEGRGLLSQDGNVHHWNCEWDEPMTGFPNHVQWSNATGVKGAVKFFISPIGQLSEMRAATPEQKQQIYDSHSDFHPHVRPVYTANADEDWDDEDYPPCEHCGAGDMQQHDVLCPIRRQNQDEYDKRNPSPTMPMPSLGVVETCPQCAGGMKEWRNNMGRWSECKDCGHQIDSTTPTQLPADWTDPLKDQFSQPSGLQWNDPRNSRTAGDRCEACNQPNSNGLSRCDSCNRNGLRPPATSLFSPGDQVRINDPGHHHHGEIGEVLSDVGWRGGQGVHPLGFNPVEGTDYWENYGYASPHQMEPIGVPQHPDPWMDNEPGSLTLPEHWGAYETPDDWADEGDVQQRPQSYEWVPTEHLAPMLEWNRNEHGDPEKVTAVQQSLLTHGFREPVWVDFNRDTNLAHLSEGNHRLTAAIQAGIPAVPVTVYRSGRHRPQVSKPYSYIGPEKDPYDPGYVPQYMLPSHIGMPTTEPWSPNKTARRGATPSPLVLAERDVNLVNDQDDDNPACIAAMASEDQESHWESLVKRACKIAEDDGIDVAGDFLFERSGDTDLSADFMSQYSKVFG